MDVEVPPTLPLGSRAPIKSKKPEKFSGFFFDRISIGQMWGLEDVAFGVFFNAIQSGTINLALPVSDSKMYIPGARPETSIFSDSPTAFICLTSIP